MTIETTASSATFAGNSVSTIFPCDFRIFNEDDVKVSLINATTGDSSPFTLNSDYTIAGAGDQDGFTLSTNVAVPSGYNLLVQRDIPYTQPTDFTNQGSFFPTMHEDAMDRIVMQVQQVLDNQSRALSMPPGAIPAPSNVLPFPSGGKMLGWAADGSALVNLNPTGVGAGSITDVNVASGAGIQASKLAIHRTDVANSVSSVVSAWLNDEVIVPTRDYGLDNTGATDNSAKMAVLLAAIQLNQSGRGRRIRFKSGTYKFNSTIAFTQYAGGLVQNMILEGDGAANTVFDFSGAPAGSDGITFDSGTHVAVRDITINSAPRDGLVLGAGLSPGGGAYLSMVTVDRVRIQGAGRHALNITNTYLTSVRDSWFKDMVGNGVNVNGFCTSLLFDRCECSGSTGGIGWALNGVIYSTLNSCGSDSNNQQGYAFSNCQGVILNGCGAESNGKDNFLLITSTASATGIPPAAQDIRGMVFNGCYGLAGSLSSPGNFATFIGANTQNSRSIEFKINGGAAHGATASDRALILAGSSGQITCHKELFSDTDCVAADSITGSAEVKNLTVVGRRAIAQNNAAQAMATAVQTTVTLSGLTTNDLGATLSSNAIVIPRGVNKVRVVGGINWVGNATGSRYLEIQKNGGSFLGIPIVKVPGIAGGNQVSVASLPINVVAGDTFSLSVVQDSGANLNVQGPSNSTYLSVEAIS